MSKQVRRVGYPALKTNHLSLPRLPIPSLKDTAVRYEQSVRAVKKKSTIDNHLAVFHNFLETDGPRVQKALVDADKSNHESGSYPFSYIEKHWDDMYLQYRGPSPVNIAPAFTLHPLGDRVRSLVEPKELAGPGVQCWTAAFIVHGMLRFAQKMLDDGIDVVSDPPTDVSQMTRQFGFTRLPREGRDTLQMTPLPEAMGHIIVMHRGRGFKVPTRDAEGRYYTPGHLARTMRNILQSASAQHDFCVSAITGASRDEWANARAALEDGHSTNRLHLEAMDTAFTVVCLDTAAWEEDTGKLLPGMLTGMVTQPSTSKGPSRVSDDIVNRWYDKHMVIVDSSDDGRVACNFEHAFSDGLTWSRYMSEVYDDLMGKKGPFAPLPTVPSVPAQNPQPVASELLWFIGEQHGLVATAAQNAALFLERLASSVKHASAAIPYGKDTIKTFGMSPDAFCQAAFHVAYYRRHGRLAPTYESCSTARYFHGRTETIRTATLPMYALCSDADVARNDDLSSYSSERKDALRKILMDVSKTHTTLAKEASMGQGIDRHLLALREKCREMESPTGLAFFNEHVYEFSGTWLMSTSNVSQNFIDWFNFGPVVSDGYGIGYNIQNTGVHASVSAFNARKTDPKGMADSIVKAANDLASVFNQK